MQHPRAKRPPGIAGAEADDFAAAVMDGLSRPHKSLPCRFFYDARGSELFEEITRLPGYYPTRTETAILETHAAEMAEAVPAGGVLVEFGSGSTSRRPKLERPFVSPAWMRGVGAWSNARCSSSDPGRMCFPCPNSPGPRPASISFGSSGGQRRVGRGSF